MDYRFIINSMPISVCDTNCTVLSTAKGADMTIESDSGYSPMALAVALGHTKSTYSLSTDRIKN